MAEKAEFADTENREDKAWDARGVKVKPAKVKLDVGFRFGVKRIGGRGWRWIRMTPRGVALTS